MIPKQIIPGASNGIGATFSSGKYNETHYLAYASSNTVVLLAIGSLKVLQVLGGHERDVKCLEWSCVGGKLASGSDNKVVVYSPVSTSKQYSDDEPPRWEAVITLQHDFEVLAVSWLPARDFLIVAGASIQIWEVRKDLVAEYKERVKREQAALNLVSAALTKQARQDYETQRKRREDKRRAKIVKCVWSTSCTSPAAHIACSPDGRFFASVGKYDKVVKVWFARPQRPLTQLESSNANGIPEASNENESDSDIDDSDDDVHEVKERISFGFVYLPHPRSVVSIAWRPLKDVPNVKRGWFFQNVLLTQSRDHVVRLWLESLNTRRQQFHMCSVITAGPDSVVNWLTSFTGYEIPTSDPFAIVKNDPNVLDDSQEHVHTSNNCTHNGIARYTNLALSSKLRTAVDWIMGVQRDGTVVIWKLKDVDSHTRQTPSLSKWNSMQVLPLPEVSPHKILAFYDLRGGTIVKDHVRVPVELSLYIYSLRGAISCWSFSIHGAASQIMNSALTARSYGHRGIIKQISSSATSPLVSTVDESNNLILWQYADTTSVDPPVMLMDVAAMAPISAVAWSTEGNICIMSNGENLFVYEMGVTSSDDGQPSTLPSKLPITVLERSAEFGSMMYIGVARDPTSALATSTSSAAKETYEHSVLVTAVSAAGNRIFVWRVNLISYTQQKSGADQVLVDSVGMEPTTSGSSTLLVEYSAEQNLTCASLVAESTASESAAKDGSHYKPFLVTGGADGNVRLWCLVEKENAKPRLREMTSFQAYTSKPVKVVRCAYFGRIATSTEGSAEVSLWELESATPTYKLENKLTFTPTSTLPELHFDWLPLDNGKHALAVGFGTILKVFSQQRPKLLQSFEVTWDVTDDFPALPHPVSALAWAKDGSLIAASASVLYVFSKWREILKNSQASDEAKEDERWITAFHRNSEYRSLPLYHPKALLEFLMAGHFERVGFILGKVLQAIEARDSSKGNQVTVPPIMLAEIAHMKKGLVAHHEEAKKKKTDEDDDYVDDVREDEILEAQSGSAKSTFGVEEAEDLSEHLMSVVLPGVSGPEQMYLLAIIDTYKQMHETRGAIDERGVRFLLAVKIYAFMRRSITGGKSLNQSTLLHSHDFIWALHSDSQETLLQTCLPAEPLWPDAKALGVGYWVTNPTTLRGLIEKVAQASFKVKKDPADCALFYLALGKRSTLSLAYKSVKDQKLVDFLASDFALQKNRELTYKNACKLLSLHRYELAAAFFLLGNFLKDAVTSLIQHTQDYQLALIVCRLFEGDNGPVFTFVLESIVLPAAMKNNDFPMASITKWLLKQYTEALTILQQVTEGNASSQSEQHNPTILNFFKFLSGHTLLRNVPQESKEQGVLLRKAAYAYIQANVDFLALEQLEELKLKHPLVRVDEPDDDEEDTDKNLASKDEKEDEKKTEKAKEETEEEPVNDIGGYGGGFGGGFSYGGGNSYGGFGETEQKSSGGGDDWFDDFLGGPPATSTSSFSSGGPSFLGSDEPQQVEEEKKKEPTKKYLYSTYPAVDVNLMLHVVLQVLIEHCERVRRLGLWRVEAPALWENLTVLSNKSGIPENEIIVELLRYCISRQYIQQAWDILVRFPSLPPQVNLFFAQRHQEHKHFSLLLSAAYDISGIASHITSHSISRTQARHISILAGEMNECTESVAEVLLPEEASLIYISIYFAEFVSAWTADETQVLDCLVKVANLKEATAAFKEGHRLLDQAEAEGQDEIDEEDDKPQNEPANSFWLKQLLRLVVLKKFVSNIEEFLSIMQASRAPSSVKLVQHLVRWLRLQQGKLGHIPVKLQKLQQQQPLSSASTILQSFSDLVHTGRFDTPTKQLWNYVSKIEPLNDFVTSIFTTTEKSHDVSLEYKMTFEGETVIYRDHDILQSFCINAADNHYVAVATTKGIREIDLRQVQVADGEEEDAEAIVGGGEEYTVAGSALRHSAEGGGKRPSISNKSTASLPLFKNKQNIIAKAFSTLTPSSKELDHNIVVQWVESHPYDPYYLSGGIDGSVCLWQFGVPEALAAYRLPPHPWVMRCRFNPSGTKFGACDTAGNLALWKFNAPEDSLRPFHSMQAHTKNTLDFAFLNNGSFIATVGISPESKRNVCLWDVLQPPHKALVSAFTDHESGASSVAYSPRHQLLITGGKKGAIYVFDIRMNKLMESVKAHTHNSKSLSIDLLEQFVVSGSSDGNIKVFDLPNLQLRETWEDIHRKQTFVRPTGVFKSPVSTYGVMAVGVVGDHIYSCGADKRLIKRKFVYH